MAADPSETKFKLSLRNEHMPAFANTGFLELSVRVQTPQTATLAVSTKSLDAPLTARTPSRESPRAQSRGSSRGYGTARFKGSYDDAGKGVYNRSLMGSFASGPSVIWREVPATDERPAYFHSETYGVSQWHRPTVPPPRALHLAPTDLKSISPRYEAMSLAERTMLLVGAPPPESDASAPAAPPPPSDFPLEAPAPDGDDDDDDTGVPSAGSGGELRARPQLPLLSQMSRNLGANPIKVRHPPSTEEKAILRERAQSKRDADLAKANRLETARRSRLEYDEAIERMARDAAEAAQAKAKAEAEAAARAKAIAEATAKMDRKGKKAPVGGGGNASAKAAQDAAAEAVAAAAAAARKKAGAAVAKEKRMTMSQLENHIESRLGDLRDDPHERYRLLSAIRDEKRAADERKQAAPGYKPFVQLNQETLGEHAPERASVRRDERREKTARLHAAAASRHEELQRMEVVETLDAARSRCGDHWANGHWSTPLPPSMQRSPRVSPRASMASLGFGTDADDDARREGSLLLAPGEPTPWAADTAKARARRLAAKLARLPDARGLV